MEERTKEAWLKSEVLLMLVFPKVNRTGLCNMLFPWARAVVYCHEQDLKMMAPQWTHFIRIGPWLRGEQDKRYYLNQFTNEGYVSNWFGLRPKICQTKVFSGMEGYFEPFLDARALIKNELWKIVNPRLAANAKEVGKEKFIGCHIRRGDFVTIGQGTGDEWYIAGIREARRIVGNLPVRIFSDAEVEKLRGITDAVENSVIMPHCAAVQDLLSLSLSQVLVCTPCSTFSMWAVFLGQMPSVWAKSRPLPPKLYAGEPRLILVDADAREVLSLQ